MSEVGGVEGGAGAAAAGATAARSGGDPGVRLVLGPPNAGKLGRVVRWWDAVRPLDPVIVVPTLPDVPLVTLELVERVGAVLGRRPVVTFDGLVDEVSAGGGSGGDAAMVVGDIERFAALRHALASEPASRLDVLLGMTGGIESLGRLVREIDESGVAPETAVAGLRAWGDRGGGGLAHDLARLLQGHRSALTRAGRVERTAVLRSAVAAAGLWRRPVACYGFVSFMPLQRALLRRLAAGVPVLLSLIDDPDRRWAAYFAAEVDEWAGDAVSIERLAREERAYSSPQIARLERSFLSAGTPSYGAETDGDRPTSGREGASGVRFLLSSGRRAEAEFVGREVAVLLRDGVPAEQIGVLVRDMGSWHRILSRVLRAYGVPHQIDGEVGFVHTGLGAALVAALRAVSEATLEPALTCARSPYCGASAAEVDRLEAALRGTRVVEGEALVQAVCEALPDAFLDVRRLLLQDSTHGRLVDLPALRQQARRMLAVAARGRDPRSWEFEEDAACFAALDDALAQLSRAAAAGWLAEPGERGVPSAEPRSGSDAAGMPPPSFERVMECLGSLPVRLSRGDDRGVVHVMSIQRARARRFHAVFVVGLADGEFPRSDRVPLLLTAEQREAAGRAAGSPLFSELPAGEDAGLFALALSRPWQLLYLSARDAEDGGDPVSESPYWIEARRCLGDAVEVERRTLSEVVHPVDRAPSVREYLRACAASGTLPVGLDPTCVVEAGESWDCRPTRLGGESAARLVAREVFSVTEIEQYARCPFAWFIDGLVRLSEMEDSLDSRALGSVLHRALRHTYAALQAEDLLPLGSPSLHRAGDLAAEAVDRAIRELAPPGGPGERRLLRRRVEVRVAAALESDASSGGRLLPRRFESPLPHGGVDIGGVRISGRIDRVDGGGPGEPVFVIDYKSGDGGSASSFGSHDAVQVPLYLLGLRTLEPALELAGGAYLYLGGGVTKGAVVDEHVDEVGARVSSRSRYSREQFHGLLEGAREVALQSVEGMRAGLIQAEPARACPSYCELRPLCRKAGAKRRW